MGHFEKIPAKLLIFGEYTILLGAPAVTMPLWEFSSRLKLPTGFNTTASIASNRFLQLFSNYLVENKPLFENYLDLKSLGEAISNGLYLESDIPYGFGIGSSGNVCVAIFSAFKKKDVDDLSELKSLYGQMESYFHGKSSGIDPLAIHTAKPMMIQNGEISFFPDDKIAIPNNIHLYLLNSAIPRSSESFIEYFLQQIENTNVKNTVEDDYLPLLRSIIEDLSKSNPLNWNSLKKLSVMQFSLFRKMIPDMLIETWEEVNNNPKTCIKLLGAGGGGFFLVFAKKPLTQISGFKLHKINLLSNNL
jgi:mevalonate kinase